MLEKVLQLTNLGSSFIHSKYLQEITQAEIGGL